MEHKHFTAQVRNVPPYTVRMHLSTHRHTHRACIWRSAETFILIWQVSKSPTLDSTKYISVPSLKFYKIYMVGVKENIVNCTILLTPKSNFFCLVYLDFSVCFIVKQPTRVVVHKTAFESWEHTPGEPTVLAYVWFMT